MSKVTTKMTMLLTSLGYTDYLVVGGIAIIAMFLWNSSKGKKQSQIVDLKKLKVLPTQ